ELDKQDHGDDPDRVGDDIADHDTGAGGAEKISGCGEGGGTGEGAGEQADGEVSGNGEQAGERPGQEGGGAGDDESEQDEGLALLAQRGEEPSAGAEADGVGEEDQAESADARRDGVAEMAGDHGDKEDA